MDIKILLDSRLRGNDINSFLSLTALAIKNGSDQQALFTGQKGIYYGTNVSNLSVDITDKIKTVDRQLQSLGFQLLGYFIGGDEAAYRGDLETVELLINAGADIPRCSDGEGYNPLEYAYMGQWEGHRKGGKHADIIKLLEEAGAITEAFQE